MTPPYTTHGKVREVYPNIPPTADATLDMAIKTASLMVQTSILNGCMANYTPEQIEAITLYLAAHQFQVSTGVVTSKSVGAASEAYAMTTDAFLRGSLHGQQAMLLDPNNCLAQRMADTELALQGRQSFVPTLQAVPARFPRRRC